MLYFTLSFTQRGYEWHREDASASFPDLGLFAVADGITLPAWLYPNIGPRVVAETFCRESLASLARVAGPIGRSHLEAAYNEANRAVAAYNHERKQQFAATVALAAVRAGQAWLTRVNDCGLMLLRDATAIYQTPEFWANSRADRSRPWHMVVDGTGDLAPHIDFHRVAYLPDDYLLLYTDGFEPHSVEPAFHQLFQSDADWEQLPEAIKTLDQELVGRDEKRFGKERTLTVVKLAN